ncbi:hypothetical protein GCM10020218_052810 [Dactylosporangium vinaceum]
MPTARCANCALRGLRAARAARCAGCALRGLRAARAARCAGCGLRGLHVARAAGCALRGLRGLHVARCANSPLREQRAARTARSDLAGVEGAQGPGVELAPRVTQELAGGGGLDGRQRKHWHLLFSDVLCIDPVTTLDDAP